MSAALDVLGSARRRAGALLPMLERWVRENSFSTNVAGVNRMGEHLVADFALDGLTGTRYPGGTVGDHLVWVTPAWEKGGGVLLVGHHDTVFPPGAFEVWERDGDRLRGPGVLDMKGGLATVHAALGALSDHGLLARLPLAFISVGDEEIGSVHSGPLLRQLAPRASVALVFEAGRAKDEIITQRKGTGSLAIVIHGRAAHAGAAHEQGINAIWVLAQFIDEAQRMTDYAAGITINVGTASGGEAKNTVPFEARCAVDFRFLTVADGERVAATLKSSAEDIAARAGATAVVEGGIKRPPLVRSEASLALFREYAACARESGLGDSESGVLGGGSDANTMSAVDVPSIDGLGPRGRGFHTHDEYIEVSTLALRTEALVRFLLARLA